MRLRSAANRRPRCRSSSTRLERNHVSPTLDQIRAVPKVLLHDHLDGGLRPSTVIELAQETGYEGLPTHDPDELTRILTAGSHRGHLNFYLDAFRHTVGVMQTPGRAVPRGKRMR